ncbi:flippase [Aliarcobacter butzleri]
MTKLFNTAKIHILLQPIFLIFGFLWNSFLTKNLSVNDFGLFSLSLTLFSILSIFANFGMSGGLMRYIPYYEEKKKYNALKNVYYYSIFLPLAIGIVFYFFTILLKDIIEKHFIDDFGSIVNILGLYIILNAFISSQMKISITNGDFLYTKIHELIWHKIFPLGFLFLLAFYKKITIVEVAYIYIIGYILFSIIFLKNNYNYFSKINLKKFKRIFDKNFFKYSFYSSLSGLVSMLYMWSDNIMIGYFLSNYEVGIYSAIFLVAVIVRNFWYMAFVPILLPVLTRYIARGDRINTKITYDILQRTLFLLTIPLFLIFLYFGEKIISLIYTNEYLEGMPTLYALIFLYLLTIFFGYATYVINAYGDTKVTFKITIMSLIVNFILNIIFIPKFGIIGAAVATGISELLYAVICYYVVYKRYKLYINSKLIYFILLTITTLYVLYLLDSTIQLPVLVVFMVAYLMYSYITFKEVLILYKKGDN